MEIDFQESQTKKQEVIPYGRDWLRLLPPRWVFRLVAWLKLKPPPMQAIMDAGSFMLPQWMYVAVKLELPERLSARPLTSEELSALCGVDSERLGRLLYALEQRGYFRRVKDDVSDPLAGPWTNTMTSATLMANHPNTIRPIVLHWLEDCYRPAGELLASMRQNSSAFALENAPHYHSFFGDYLPAHPEKAKQFADAMTASSAFSDQAVLTDFDWSRFSKIIDGGGSNGSFLEKAMERHSGIQGVLFDLPNVIDELKNQDSANVVGFQSRVDLVAGNFFEPDTIPFVGAGEAMVLRNVLHDWNDEQCISILKNLNAAMHKHGRLILVELGLAANRGGHLMEQARSSMDMLMMTMFDGKERTRASLTKLVERAGFDVVQLRSTRSLFQVIEASPSGQ